MNKQFGLKYVIVLLIKKKKKSILYLIIKKSIFVKCHLKVKQLFRHYKV